MSKITTSDLSPLRLTSSTSYNIKPTSLITTSKKVVPSNENYLKPSPSAFLISPMMSNSSHPHNSQESNKASTTAASNQSNESGSGINPTSFRDRTNNLLDYNINTSAQKAGSHGANVHTCSSKKALQTGLNTSQVSVISGVVQDNRSATPGVRKSSESYPFQERSQNKEIGSIKDEVQRLRKEFLELKEREGKYQSRIANLERENKVLRDLLRQSEKTLEEETRNKKLIQAPIPTSTIKFDKSMQACLDEPLDSSSDSKNAYTLNKLAHKLKEIELHAKSLAISKANEKQSSCQCRTNMPAQTLLNKSVEYSQQITALQTQIMELSRKYNELFNKHNTLIFEHITLKKEKEVFENTINFMCQQTEQLEKPAIWPAENTRLISARQDSLKTPQIHLMQMPTPGSLKVLQMASAKHS